LKKKVAETDPAFSMMKYVKYRQPKRAISRDSTAVNQGFQVPPHIQCAAFGQAIRVDIDEAKELLRLADIALKDSPSGVDPWRYTNPFWLIYRGGKFVIDLVRQNRIKALVGLAVALVGLIAADYALAWRNLSGVLRFLGLK
jgi:hypothetical protein